MAAVEVGITPAPADAQWVWIPPNQLDIQGFGEFAVNQQNERHHWNLTFNAVYQSWNMTLASDSGNLYLLHLKALKNDILVNYQAIVWVKPKECVKAGCDYLTLVSFRQLSSPPPPEV